MVAILSVCNKGNRSINEEIQLANFKTFNELEISYCGMLLSLLGLDIQRPSSRRTGD